MKKIFIILIVICISLIFINCGEPSESIVHYITLEPGEEMVFQLDAVTKWDTIEYSRGLPEHAEFYEIFINEDDPPYYCFRYIAVPHYVPPSGGGGLAIPNGSSDQFSILLKREADYTQVQTHYFHVFFVNNEELP